jgi:hypothetical protein
MDGLLESIAEELRLLCDAIRRDDDRATRSLSKALHGDETLMPKREAINERKLLFLMVFLGENETIDDSLMTAACERRQRDGWSDIDGDC